MFKRDKSMMLFGLDENQSSYKGLLLFLFVYLGATLFASVFTVPAYWGVQWLHSVSPCDLTDYLLKKGMRVYFDRLRWIPILIGLPWVLAKCGLFSLSNLGISFDKLHLRCFLRYLLIGFSLGIFIIAAQLFFTDVSYKGNFTFLTMFKTALGSAVACMILGFLEELVFRGLIMRSAYSAWGVWSAMIFSSLFFAYKHFKVPKTIWQNIPSVDVPTWDLGFLAAYYDSVGILYTMNIPVFLSLFMFGMLLCAIYIRTKTLMAPIALHAGIVFCIQNYKKYFNVNPDAMRDFFGSAGMTDGYLALGLLSFLFLLLVIRKKA